MTLRVLLVDDDARFRAAACRTLAADGVDVVAQVDNGGDVVAVIARCRPDVVLLDIGLPDIDGVEVARRLRTEQGGPVVILISTRDVAYGTRMAAGVASGYLPKDQLSGRAILDLVPSGGMTSRRLLVRDAVAMLRNAARRHPVDPTLELVYTRAGGAAWIEDDLGRPEPRDSGRMRTPVERQGKPLAALLHDPALARNPGRLRAAVEAASLAIDNEALKAELPSQLRDVQASRTRLVEAADRERRRVERNLHDGAQQRLVGLALTLRLAGRQAADDPAVAELLVEASRELDDALAELRRLARGVHPAIVSDAGLAVALESLAERPGLPVELAVDLDPALPEAVEIAAYYVVAEALANTKKHGQASRVAVQVTVVGETLHVCVADDGQGGATIIPESGLEGLADRVSALGGMLRVDSPAGRGTTVAADLPLGLPPHPARSPRSPAAIRWMGWDLWEVPPEIYETITYEDGLIFAKAVLLCAGGHATLTERERNWYYGYRAACGDSDQALEAVRAYDDADRLEDLAGLPTMVVTVRAMIFDALRLCAADGPVTAEEYAQVLQAARRINVAPDLVAALRQIVADSDALRRRRYELVSAPMFSGGRAPASRGVG